MTPLSVIFILTPRVVTWGPIFEKCIYPQMRCKIDSRKCQIDTIMGVKYDTFERHLFWHPNWGVILVKGKMSICHMRSRSDSHIGAIWMFVKYHLGRYAETSMHGDNSFVLFGLVRNNSEKKEERQEFCYQIYF